MTTVPIPPFDRVASLSPSELHAALLAVITAVVGDKSTRAVPDVLHEHGLLSDFETYDADSAWTTLEDEVARWRPTVNHIGW